MVPGVSARIRTTAVRGSPDGNALMDRTPRPGGGITVDYVPSGTKPDPPCRGAAPADAMVGGLPGEPGPAWPSTYDLPLRDPVPGRVRQARLLAIHTYTTGLDTRLEGSGAPQLHTYGTERLRHGASSFGIQKRAGFGLLLMRLPAGPWGPMAFRTMIGVRCFSESPRTLYFGPLFGSIHTAIVGGPLPILLSGPASALNRHFAPSGSRAGPKSQRRNSLIQPNIRNRVGYPRLTSWAFELERPAIPALPPVRARDGTRFGIRDANVWFALTLSTPRNSRTPSSAHTIGIRSAGGWKYGGGLLDLGHPRAAFAASRCTGGARTGPR
jgi:hypothetical protein